MEDLEHTATCRFCGASYKRNGIARHIGACPARCAQAARSKTALFHHLAIADAYLPEYWLHVLAAPDITLRELDMFFREIWVECCGHQSLFEVAGRRIVSLGNTRLNQLPESSRITYAYDFGSATVLRIRQLKQVDHGADGERIVLAARNDPPLIECAGGGAATIFARDLLDDPDEDAFFCEKCLERYEGDPEMLAPLTNSPRMGVCGYDGPGADIQGEYASFEDADRQIRDFAGTADSVRIKIAQGRERDDLLRKYIDDLRTMPVGARNFRAARLIQRNISAFARPLRDMLLHVLGEYGNKGTVPTDHAHLFAIYLLTQDEEGALFSDLAPYFSRYDVIKTLWGKTFNSSYSWDSLWASLSRNNPELLLTFALEETTEPFLRANAVNSLVSLYLEDYLEREKLVDYLHLLVEKAVNEQERLFGRILAMICCTVYPDDVIRDLQKLHRSDLLDPSVFDYPDDIRRVLQRNTREGHLKQARETRAFTLVEDPLRALRELFRQSTQESMQESTHETTRETPPADEVDTTIAVSGPAAGTVKRTGRKIGRNEPCPCGSGKKYKHCCGRG